MKRFGFRTIPRIWYWLAFVNILLLALWLWSGSGQTTVLRLKIEGNQFIATVDGKKLLDHTIDAPPDGGLAITLDENALPSLPSPRGIDRVIVRDLRDDKVLLEDDFNDAAHTSATWLKLDHVSQDGGLVNAHTHTAFLATGGPNWTDYEVELVLRNVAGITVELRDREDGGVRFGIRPFRHLDSALTVTHRNERTGHFTSPPVSPNEFQTIKSMTAMLLKPYPRVAAFALLATAAVFIGVPLLRRISLPRASVPPMISLIPVLLVLGLAFSASLYLMITYYENVPHVPDELSYLRQAKVLASGRFAAPVPVSPESFQFFFPAFDVIENGRWASIYPFGHPLALAPAVGLGLPWLMPPVLGATSVGLLYVLSKSLYGKRTALASAALLAVSPFFLMTASNFTSHNTAAVLLLGALVSMSRIERRPLLYSVICGVCLGLLFNTRPLTGLAALLPIALWIGVGALRTRPRRNALSIVGGGTAAGLAMLLLYFGYEYATSGGFLSLADSQAGTDTFGFSGTHRLGRGLSNEQTQLSLLVLVAHNWPVEIGLVLALLPFALLSRHRWDWFLGGLVLCLMGAYTLYSLNGIMQGPRFWYETLPLLVLLSVRGVEVLTGTVVSLVAQVKRLRDEERVRIDSAVRGTALVAVVLLAAHGGYDWMFGNGFSWRADLVPSRAEALEDFNGLRPEFARMLADADLDNAIVLVEACPHWQCYGSVYLQNNVSLDSNVVFARNLANVNRDLLLAYADRHVFVADYGKMTLAPYGGRMPPPLARDAAEDFPEARLGSQQASKHPDLVAARDQRRRNDLERIAEVIQTYYQLTGSVPEARSLQSVCIFAGDAGCALKRVLDPLPLDPFTDKTYWYFAEGDSYILYASLEGTYDELCADVPQHLAAEKNVYCLQGRVSIGSDSR